MKRTHFLVASASLAAAATGTSAAATVPGGPNLVERNANFDEAAFRKIVGRPAKIRQVFEQVAFKPAILDNIKNSLNGLNFGYGYPAESIVIAFAAHGPSAAYAYSDYVWQKYKIGNFFGIETPDGFTATNRWLKQKSAFDPSVSPDAETGMYQDTSIEMLQRRGVVFLTCHTAVEEQSRALVKSGHAPAGMSGTEVASDILTHLIPGAVVVPSMVATVAVLQQEFRYTYAAITF